MSRDNNLIRGTGWSSQQKIKLPARPAWHATPQVFCFDVHDAWAIRARYVGGLLVLQSTRFFM